MDNIKYDYVGKFSSNGLAYVKLNGKYGFIDQTGKIIIPLKYDYVGDFFDRLAYVELNGKYGFINKKALRYFEWVSCIFNPAASK